MNAIPPTPPAEKIRVATTPPSVELDARGPVDHRRAGAEDRAREHHVATEGDHLEHAGGDEPEWVTPARRCSTSSTSAMWETTNVTAMAKNPPPSAQYTPRR